MGWAAHYIKKLQAGEAVQFRPRGNSMQPRIKNGALVTVIPLFVSDTLEVGDVVLCMVGGREYLHLIKAIRDNVYQIGNNKGRINGWIPLKRIYGRVVEVGT